MPYSGSLRNEPCMATKKIRKGERIYEHENENAIAQPSAVLRDAGWPGADKCICMDSTDSFRKWGRRMEHPTL